LKMVFSSKGKIKLEGEKLIFINYQKKPKLDLVIDAIKNLC